MRSRSLATDPRKGRSLDPHSWVPRPGVVAFFVALVILASLEVPSSSLIAGYAAGATGVPGCTGGPPIDYGDPQGPASPAPAASTSAGVASLTGASSNASSCGWKAASVPAYIAQHEYALWSAAYATPSTLVAVGDLGTILRSVDGGRSWTPVTDPAPSQDLHVVVAASNGVLWAAGTDGVVLQSLNAGATWANFSASGLEGNITTLTFGTGSYTWFGYAATSAGVFISRDSGNSWSPVATPVGTGLRSAAFFDPDHGWVEGNIPSGGAGVFYTSDGGVSWTQGVTGGLPSTSRNIVATGPSQAWMLGSREYIFQTSNGLNWSSKEFTIDLEVGGSPVGPALDVLDGQYGWATEQEGNMFYTSDGGGCWMEQGVITIPEFYGLEFLNPSDGVAVGTGVIWYTTDGGSSPGDLPGTIGGVSCLPTLPYDPEVLGTAVGIGVGSGILFLLMMQRQEPKTPGPPLTPVDPRAEERQARRLRYRKRRRYVGG